MKLTERQKEEVPEYWDRLLSQLIATTPVEQLWQLKRKFEAGAPIRMQKRKARKWWGSREVKS
jgi:hypothetical protein